MTQWSGGWMDGWGASAQSRPVRCGSSVRPLPSTWTPKSARMHYFPLLGLPRCCPLLCSGLPTDALLLA